MGVWEQVLEVGVCRSGACERVIFLLHTLARISTESSAAASLTLGHIIARRGPLLLQHKIVKVCSFD